MRVVRAAGQNVSPSDDGRLYAQIFSDGLFTDTTFTNLGGNSVQVGAMYGDLCGRDFTIEQMTMTVILPEGEGETTGYIYVEIDTSSDDVISLNSALAPFTPTYEDINTNGAVAQMIIAEYTATAVAVTGVTAVYEKAAASSVKAGSIATVESAQATENHSAGDYILLNGQMYLVTASVSVGETFVEGTNITAVSIGDELTALNAGLTYKLKGTVTGATVISYPANFDVAKITIEYVFGGSTNFCYTFELTKAELADLTSSSYRFYRQGYYYSASDSGVCTLATTSDFIVLNTLRHGTTDYSASAKVTMYYR